MQNERNEFIQALRDLALFLECHENAPIPDFTSICTFVQTKEQLVALIRHIGKVEKDAAGSYFWIEKRFGANLKYEVNIERAKVCERKVIGTQTVPAHEEEIVEWECHESLLADAQ